MAKGKDKKEKKPPEIRMAETVGEILVNEDVNVTNQIKRIESDLDSILKFASFIHSIFTSFLAK